jgi:hypothetical protein
VAASLASYLADGSTDALSTELAEWLSTSRPFRSFAETYRDKIRKKLRSAADAESRRDVRAELAVARALLGDRHTALAFEPAGQARGGPDFTVTWRGERRFTIEVTRPRGGVATASIGGTLLAKLRQLPPSVPNVLLMAVDGAGAVSVDVAATVRDLRSRADRRDDAFFSGRGLVDARHFYDRFLRLGAVIVWAEDAIGPHRASAWPNPSARITVPDRALRACVAALRAA